MAYYFIFFQYFLTAVDTQLLLATVFNPFQCVKVQKLTIWVAEAMECLKHEIMLNLFLCKAVQMFLNGRWQHCIADAVLYEGNGSWAYICMVFLLQRTPAISNNLPEQTHILNLASFWLFSYLKVGSKSYSNAPTLVECNKNSSKDAWVNFHLGSNKNSACCFIVVWALNRLIS